MRCIPFSVNFSNCRIYIVGVSNLEKNLRERKMHFSSDIEQQFHLRSSVTIEKIKKSPWMSINLIYNVEIGKEHALKKILKNQFMEVKKVQHIFLGVTTALIIISTAWTWMTCNFQCFLSHSSTVKSKAKSSSKWSKDVDCHHKRRSHHRRTCNQP